MTNRAPYGFRDALSSMRKRRLPRAGAVAVVLLLFITVFADLLASQLPVLCTYQDTFYVLPNVTKPKELSGLDCAGIARAGGHVYLSPLYCHGPQEESPSELLLPPASPHHWLGTDALGRDVFARTVHGARTSLTFALLSTLVFVGFGAGLGAVSGFFGGTLDALTSRAVETMSAFPTLILAIGVQAMVPRPTILTLFAAIVLSRWAEVTKLTRAEVIQAATSDYALAARALGASPLRVLVSHVMPNARAAAIISATFGLGSVVLAEASLTFLRAGHAGNVASWGEMLSEVRDNPAAWWMLVFPGALLLIVILSFNVLGEALRDALDPRVGSDKNTP
jgi:peptide/nickel transport system permease protein